MEEKQKTKTRKSGKTLQTAREAGYFGKKMLKQALEAMEENRPIGWSMVTWWQGEIIAKAMGVHLVFPENYGAFCAASRKEVRLDSPTLTPASASASRMRKR